MQHSYLKVTLTLSHSQNQMSELYAKVSELMENQKHILEAIQIKGILVKAKNNNSIQVDNILESQVMLDEIVVKNFDA